MGLNITNLSAFPVGVQLNFYIYFLDYGWDNELSEAMYENFRKFSGITERNNSVVVQGMHREHFANEVLSWHSINGTDAEGLLPAIMITDINPHDIHESNNDAFPLSSSRGEIDNPSARSVTPDRFVIIPLADHCKTKSDVTRFLEALEKDLSSGSCLSDFSIHEQFSKSKSGLADVLILEPNFMGMGFDLKKLFNLGRKRVSGGSQSDSSDADG